MKGFAQNITALANPKATAKWAPVKGYPLPGRIDLGTWIENTVHPGPRFQKATQLVEEARKKKEEGNEEAYKAAKRRIPCVKPSGLFDTSDGDQLLEHSGWIQIDLDTDENPQIIGNIEPTKEKIAQFDEVAFVARSTTDGAWGLVKLPDPDTIDEDAHKHHFYALKKALKEYGYTLDDKTKNPGRLRFFSLDPEPIIKDPEQVRPFMAKLDHDPDLPPRPRPKPIKRMPRRGRMAPLEFAHSLVERQQGAFSEGNQHNFLYNLACITNKMAIDRSELEAFVEAHLIPLSQVRTNCLSYPYEQYTDEAGTWDRRTKRPPRRTTSTSPRTDQKEAERKFEEEAASKPTGPSEEPKEEAASKSASPCREEADRPDPDPWDQILDRPDDAPF